MFQLNLAVNRNARKTLEFFRDWQQKMNPGDDTHPNHHDVAVLLTRYFLNNHYDKLQSLHDVSSEHAKTV